MDNMKIGIFDSGIGGLTILKEVRKLLPRENILYYGDFQNTPYGDKTPSEVLNRSIEITDFMIRNHCKVVIVGCSLFSAASLAHLRKMYSIPIIGMIEPGIKASLLESENNEIGLIGNPFTVDKNAYLESMKRHSEEACLHQVPCRDLCQMIERGWEDYPERLEVLKGYLDMLPDVIDTLILGGTHYPFIIDDIRRFFKGSIVDSSREGVIEVLDTLISRGLLNKLNRRGSIEFCVTGDRSPLDKNIKKILKKNDSYSIYNLY